MYSRLSRLPFDTLGDYFPEFRKKRIEKKIPARIILNDSPLARERQRLGPVELREVRITLRAMEHHGAVFIWKNKVTMFSLQKDIIALVVESDEISNAQRAMFEIIWGSLSSPRV